MNRIIRGPCSYVAAHLIDLKSVCCFENVKNLQLALGSQIAPTSSIVRDTGPIRVPGLNSSLQIEAGSKPSTFRIVGSLRTSNKLRP